MKDSHTIRPDRAHPQKCTARPDKNKRSATYNYTDMKTEKRGIFKKILIANQYP